MDTAAMPTPLKRKGKKKKTYIRATPTTLVAMLEKAMQESDSMPDFSLLNEDNEQDLGTLRSWTAGFIKKKSEICSSFRIRTVIRQIKRNNRSKIEEFLSNIDRTKALYQAAGERYEQCEALQSTVDRLRKKRGGIIKSMDTNPKTPFRRSTKQEKNKKAQEFLEQADEQLAIAQKELNDYLIHIPEWADYRKAKQDYQNFKDEIGISNLELKLEEQLSNQGSESSKHGYGFESSSLPVAKDLISSLVIGENPILQELTTSLGEASFSTKDFNIHVLSGVTLGCSNAELDFVIVREPIIPESDPTSQLLDQMRNARKQAKTDIINKIPPVEVLGIIECKRNVNDIGRSFAHFQQTLSWFTSEREIYDTAMFKTKFYTAGHFDKPYIHMGDSYVLKFEKTSFDNFRRDPVTGLFVDRLYFITSQRSILSGMHAQQKSILEYKLSTDINLDLSSLGFNTDLLLSESSLSTTAPTLASEQQMTSSSLQYFHDLLIWIKQQMADETSTKDVFKLFSTKEEWAKQIIFMS